MNIILLSAIVLCITSTITNFLLLRKMKALRFDKESVVLGLEKLEAKQRNDTYFITDLLIRVEALEKKV